MFLFSFVSRYFQNPLLIISLTQWFKSVLFSFRTFVTFPAFLLLLTFSFILLWSEQILSRISTLNLLRLVLQPNFVIHPGECSLCAWEECVLFCWVESCGQLLGLLALSSCLSLLFIDFMSGWSVDYWKRVLKSPTITVFLLVSFSDLSIFICFIYLDAVMFHACTFTTVISSS